MSATGHLSLSGVVAVGLDISAGVTGLGVNIFVLEKSSAEGILEPSGNLISQVLKLVGDVGENVGFGEKLIVIRFEKSVDDGVILGRVACIGVTRVIASQGCTAGFVLRFIGQEDTVSHCHCGGN